MLFGGGTDFQSHRDHREHREGFPNAFLCELGVLCGFSHFTALISIIGIIEVTPEGSFSNSLGTSGVQMGSAALNVSR